MTTKLKITVIGGDMRLVYAARRLSDEGFSVSVCAAAGDIAREDIEKKTTLRESLAQADAVLLPIPLTTDGVHLFAPEQETKIPISEVFSFAPKNAVILAGRAGAFADERLYDYGKREDFAVMNAVPTAEGALLLAMQELSETIHGLPVGIVGFGRVGVQTAKLFHAAGAHVTIFARRAEARAAANAAGYASAPISSLPARAGDLRLLINTVPARVIDENVLSAMKGDTLILELASEPFGLDFEAAKEKGIHAVLARALPGKYFPKTAGEVIAAAVTNILYEKFDME